MAEFRNYEVFIGGVRHVMQYTPDEGRRRGLTEVVTKAREPENKARAPRNKSSKSDEK